MDFLQDIEFLNKIYFLLILLVPFLVFLFYKKQKKGINFIFYSDLKEVFKKSSILFYFKIFLIILIFLNFIILFANPNTTNVKENIEKEGIDIVLALDISASMDATDFQPSRIEAAKIVIDNFIKKIKTDRLGLVVFAGKPFTSIPLTFDYNILTETIDRLSTSNINQNVSGLNGTAIGDAILMGKTLFESSNSVEKSLSYNSPGVGGKLETSPQPSPSQGEGVEQDREKVIILLTDGDANVGVEPTLAGLSAKEDGIKIYTIGIGSEKGGIINYDVGPFKKQQKIPPLNEKDLKQIAKDTSGKYFRATDNTTFQKIFDELSSLQKTDINIEVKKEYSEYYNIFLYSLIILLGIFTYIMINKVEIGKD